MMKVLDYIINYPNYFEYKTRDYLWFIILSFFPWIMQVGQVMSLAHFIFSNLSFRRYAKNVTCSFATSLIEVNGDNNINALGLFLADK